MLAVLIVAGILISMIAAGADRARYMAELAVCQAAQKHIGIAVLQYASANKWRYPHRPGVFDSIKFTPATLGDGQPSGAILGALRRVDYDDRPMLRDLLPINSSLNCPLVRPVDLEQDLGVSERIYASQALWFGWQFQPAYTDRKERGMFRLGNRFTWEDDAFRILASDWTVFSREDNVAVGSHPDYYDGIMVPELGVDRRIANTLERATYSFWVSNQTWSPGPVDRTFLHDDGSVERLDRVNWRLSEKQWLIWEMQKWSKSDDRMVRVPERARELPTQSTHLPKG